MRKTKAKERLTTKQESYALEFMMNGKIIINAYRKVYDVDPTRKDSGIYVDAHRVHTNPKVSLRIHQLEMAEYSNQILTINERKQLLSKMCKDGDTKAMEILNKMEGIYIEKKQIEHSGQIINRTINVNPTKKKVDK